MARALTSAVASATQARVVLPVWLAELNFDSGVDRFTTSNRDLTYDGNTYTALGDFAGVSPISEASDLSASGVILRISGITTARISEALTEKVQGRSAKLWAGFLDPTTYALLADPAGPFVFRMDSFNIVMGETASITLSCESRAILWNTANTRRYTDVDQQAVHTGDKFFEFVPDVADKEIIWPGKGSDAASPVSQSKGLGSTIPASVVASEFTDRAGNVHIPEGATFEGYESDARGGGAIVNYETDKPGGSH